MTLEQDQPHEAESRSEGAERPAPPTPAEVRSHDEVLSASNVAGIRGLFAEAADRQQALRADAFKTGETEDVRSLGASIERSHAIAIGEPVIAGTHVEDLAPYRSVAESHLILNGSSDRALGELARSGVTAELVAAELRQAEAELTSGRIILLGENDVGAPEDERDATVEKIERTMQEVAELQHLAAGGSSTEAPLAMQRLSRRLSLAKELDLEASRKKVAGMNLTRPE